MCQIQVNSQFHHLTETEQYRECFSFTGLGGDRLFKEKEQVIMVRFQELLLKTI